MSGIRRIPVVYMGVGVNLEGFVGSEELGEQESSSFLIPGAGLAGILFARIPRYQF